MFAKKIHFPHLLKHQTKRKVVLKFFLVLTVFLLYFLYISLKFGVDYGFMVTLLTWSFFVLCTPIADAGFLLDFPIRLILNLKMWLSELFVWAFAISLNLYFFFLNPEIYQKTELLKIFHQLLEKPVPYWSIIVLSGLGTFLSVYFADELLDKVKRNELHSYHKLKFNYALISILAIFAFIFFLYYELLQGLNIKII